jgi:hypothetical protein
MNKEVYVAIKTQNPNQIYLTPLSQINLINKILK